MQPLSSVHPAPSCDVQDTHVCLHAFWHICSVVLQAWRHCICPMPVHMAVHCW